MRLWRSLAILIWPTLAVVAATQPAKDAELPPSLRAKKPQTLLCVAERSWTCNGVGNCEGDYNPETISAWKIDVARSRYSVCRRDGSHCAEWHPFSSKLDTAFLILHESDWHPETFKIDRDAGKFVAVRLSGAATELDFSTKPATIRPDLSRLQVITRTGTCIPLDN